MTAGILALIGLLVYYIKRKVMAENNMAALENSKTASDAKIELLEDQKLKNEYAKRDEERAILDGIKEDDPDGASFYPGRLRPRDPNDLN